MRGCGEECRANSPFFISVFIRVHPWPFPLFIPLPMISYGGSSLTLLGILMNVSEQAG